MLTFDFILQFLGVAALVAASDVCASFYTMATADREPAKAAAWSVAITAFSAVTVVSFMHDLKLIFAAMVGAWIGTYFTIRYANSFEEGSNELTKGPNDLTEVPTSVTKKKLL